MSAIPPNWLGSIAQTPGAQVRAAEERARQTNAQTEQTSGGSFADRLQDVIEEADRDGQVYADAEGSGSQGRPFESNEQDSSAEDKNSTSPDSEAEEGGLDVQG